MSTSRGQGIGVEFNLRNGGSTLYTGSSFLDKIPLEIRNYIYQICIEDSKQSHWWDRSPPGTVRVRGFGLSILPRLYDPPMLQIEGYGAIPLRCTNRQVYEELARQVSFNVDRVRIGSYNFEHKEQDPYVHWRTAYTLLENHPGLPKSVKHVTIKMPSIRDERLRSSQLSFAHMDPNLLRKFEEGFAAIVPGLVHCLNGFQSLQRLSIKITVEKRNPPTFYPVLPLYAICEPDTEVEISPPQEGLRSYEPWITKWEHAWGNCLRNKEIEDKNIQTALLAGAKSGVHSSRYP